MTSTFARLACKAFLERQSPQRQSRLVRFLPREELSQMEAIDFAHPDWVDSPIKIDDALDLVHPSWLLAFLQTCPPFELGCFLASLQPQQANALKSQLRYLRPLPPLTPLGKAYLRAALLKKIPLVEQAIPLQALPQSSFLPLASFSFRDLVRLSFSLGLRDLSQYFRQVIDKAKLKNIEQALSQEERQIVQQLSLKKDPLSMGRQGFDAWDGHPEKLRMMIEQRGINRLAKALFSEHSSLLWYITHIFDTARGAFFQKVCTESPTEATHLILQEQIFETLNSFLKRE